jgi:hypothetical protein
MRTPQILPDLISVLVRRSRDATHLSPRSCVPRPEQVSIMRCSQLVTISPVHTGRPVLGDKHQAHVQRVDRAAAALEFGSGRRRKR